MNLLSGRNAHEILPVALDRLFKQGVPRETRNGPVLQLEGPTLICYERPLERVVFWPERNANPFFHFMESLWMLAGKNDVSTVATYTKNIARYSNDGITFNGAYGHRWRSWFGRDQLIEIITNLAENKDCRRQVLGIWDPAFDLFKQAGNLDVPCNTHAYFAVNPRGELDLTVCNRSNDIVWGALGANVVHFSYLLEYVASMAGYPVGKYYQFTNNLHGYLTTIEPLRELTRYTGAASPYELGEVTPFNGFMSGTWHEDLARFHEGRLDELDSPFFKTVARPIENAHRAYRLGSLTEALDYADSIAATDWGRACREWLIRVRARRERAKDDGVSYE